MSKRTVTEAERAHALFNMLTPADVAERLSRKHINADTVRSWMKAGWLEWWDMRRDGATRPAYFTTWEAVERYMANVKRNAA